jgi:hypothetical protein
MAVCSVDGCCGQVASLGFCGKHYQRFKKRGTTADYLGCHAIKRVCSVDGCGGGVEAKGLCEKHYVRLKTHGSHDENNRTHAPVEVRFWRYVEKTDSCWVWTGGSKNQKGYGQIGSGGKGAKHILAHRLSYEIHKGKIPDGMVVMHSCDNPSCVNPDHLSIGTQSQNILEAFSKGRKNSVPPHVYGDSCGASKLNKFQAIEVIESTDATKLLAAKYGVSKSAIERVRNGKTWRHLPRT